MPVRKLQRGGRAAWGVTAALLSLLLHGVLLNRLPPFPLGRVDDQHPWKDYPAIVLRDTKEMSGEVERPPARFRPENPGEVLEQLAQTVGEGPVAGGFDLPVPPAPELSRGTLQGESQALMEPQPEAARPLWDPREEIIQIDRAVLDEQVATLPRRYTETIDRRVRVPDVTLPMETPAEWMPAVGGAGEPGIEAASRAIEWPEGWGPTLLGALEPGGDWTAVATVLSGPSSAETPRPEAVERYLAVDTQVFRATDEDGAVYFRLEIKRHGDDSLPVLPKDLLLLQDSSESITPAKLAECKRGLRRWLDYINPGDRFQIIGFSDHLERCFPEGWQPMTPRTRAQALAFIDGLRATGNTDVYGTLEAAATIERDPDRPLLAVLVTDGRPTTGVMGSSEIIERFSTANHGGLSLFSVGAGRRVNRFLLDLASYRNRGDALVVPEETGLLDAMDRWARETRNPVLADLRYRFSGVPVDAVYPRALTPLFLDRSLVLYGRVPPGGAEAAFQVLGRSGRLERDLVFPLDLAKATEGGPDIRQRWAWHRIYHLIGEHTRTGDASLVGTIRAISAQYGLVVPYGYGESVPRW